MSVRNKFVDVHSLWQLCARAHAHSLEGTLPTTGYFFDKTKI